ncbi:MAG: hypothetical protein CL424_13755 [Acidimicrobiaceae bacterium]|nr:hypothetical protein [Acidimicrobiaceae bacterium]
MDWSASNVVRIVGYLLVAVAMMAARRREARRVGDAEGVWPGFWTATAVFVMAMAVGRALEAGDVVSSLGRSAAGESGWYDSRRPVQAAVVGIVGGAWFVVVAVALWRTPERRRRYLPVGLMVVTLAAFAAVRVISLHQIDSVLYRTDVGGVRVATLVELVLLALTGLATWWCPPARRPATEHLIDTDRRV